MLRLISVVLITTLPAAWTQLPHFQPAVTHPSYLPLPEKYPIVERQQSYSFDATNMRTLEVWETFGPASIKPGEILLTSKNSTFYVGTIFNKMNIPPTFVNWRIELIASSSDIYQDETQQGSAPSMGLFIATRDSLNHVIRENIMEGKLQGFVTIMTSWFYNQHNFVQSFSMQPQEGIEVAVAGTYDSNDGEGEDKCSNQANQLTFDATRTVLIIIQNVDDQITVAYAATDVNEQQETTQEYDTCIKNWKVTGLSSLIANGNMTIALSGFTQGFIAQFHALSLDFYTMRDVVTTTLPPTTTTPLLMPPVQLRQPSFYYGAYIGPLTQNSLRKRETAGQAFTPATGDVYAASLTTIAIVNFTYDGEKVPSFFLASTSPTEDPRKRVVIPDEKGLFSTLRRYQSEMVVLQLPKQITVRSLKWFAVWNRDQTKSAGRTNVPTTFQPPDKVVVGKFNDTDPDLSGNVVAVDSRTLEIDQFSFTLRNHSTYFWGWLDDTLTNGFPIHSTTFKNGETVPPLNAMTLGTMALQLPANVSLKDVTYLSLYSPHDKTTHGRVRLKKADMERLPAADVVPPKDRVFSAADVQMDSCQHVDKQFEVRWKFLHAGTISLRYMFSVGKNEWAAFGMTSKDGNVPDFWVSYWDQAKGRAIVSDILVLGLPQQCWTNATSNPRNEAAGNKRAMCYEMKTREVPITGSSNRNQAGNTNATEVSFVRDVSGLSPGSGRSLVWAIGALEVAASGNVIFLTPTKTQIISSADSLLPATSINDTSQCIGVVYEEQKTTTTTTTTTTKRPPPSSTTPRDETKPREPDLPKEEAVPRHTTDELLEQCQDFSSRISAPPNNGNATMIETSLIVDKFLGIDDVDEAISISGTLFAQWEITTCKSNATKNDMQEQRIFVAAFDSVWRPRMIFRSSPDDVYMQSDQFGDDLVAVLEKTYEQENTENYTLRFLWMRVGIYKSKCELVLTAFPFDKQTCTFEFSLQRSYNLVQFRALSIELPQTFSDIGEWILDRNVTESTYKEIIQSTAMKNQVHSATFIMRFQRKPDYFAFNLLAPALVLTFLNVASFLMPAKSPERSTFAVTILLALTVSQNDVLNNVPKSSQRILLSDYILLLQLFCAGCTFYDMAILGFCNLPRIGKKDIEVCCFNRAVKISIARLSDVFAVSLAIMTLGVINFYAINVIMGGLA